MFEMKEKAAKMKPKFVLLVPCLVLLAACSTKQIENASLDPISAQEEVSADGLSTPTPEPESTAELNQATDALAQTTTADSAPYMAAASTGAKTHGKKFKKAKSSSKVASKAKSKKNLAKNHKKSNVTVAAAGRTGNQLEQNIETPKAEEIANALNKTGPEIGDASLNQAAIEMPLVAPPIPMNEELEAPQQPNWILAALTIAGIVGLIGVIFRLRRSHNRKRGLVFN